MWLVHAKKRVGYNNSWKSRFANTTSVAPASPCKNLHKGYGQVLAGIGIDKNDIRAGTSFYYSDSAKDFAESIFLNHSGKFVAINLGAGVENKLWSVNNFVDLAKKIFVNLNIKPIVFTNPGQEHRTHLFKKLYGEENELIVLPLTEIDRVGAVIHQCAYSISGDSSLLHLSMGLKTPTLGIFTFTRPELVAPEDCIFVSVFKEDFSHFDECGNPFGSTDIPVEDVYNGFLRLQNLVEQQNDIGT